MKKQIDFEVFVKLFWDIYEMLYENDALEDEFQHLAYLFDECLKNESFVNDVVRPFGKQREDFISSDREAISFMMAWYIITQGEAPNN